MEYEDMIRETIGALRVSAYDYRRDGSTERADHLWELADRWQEHLREIMREGAK